MSDIGFEFDAVAAAPACGPADWASASGVDGHLREHEPEPEAVEGDATGCWRAAQPAPLRPWWGPRSAPGATAA